MSARFPVQHCPYCGEVDLFPDDGESGGWECRSCLRGFVVRPLASRSAASS